MVNHMIYYNQKGGKQMDKKKKHKRKRSTIDYKMLLANAIVDLIIGILLLIIEHYIF